jgi:hypothetical protein
MYLIITVGETRKIDVVFKRVCGTNITLENYKYYMFCVCDCSLSYPACNAHAPYYIIISYPSAFNIYFHITS